VVNRGSGWLWSLSMWVLLCGSCLVSLQCNRVANCLSRAPNPPLPRHTSHWGSVYAHFLVSNAGHRTRTATGKRGHGLGHYRAQNMKLCGAFEEDWQAQSVDALATPGVQGQVHALIQAGESVGGPWG
jgi:hypothetical protein